MAIAFDQNLGTATATDNTANITLTTSAAAASKTRIVLFCGWFEDSATIVSITGGGLNWHVDRFMMHNTIPNDMAGIASAYAPSGLASSTAIVVTFSVADVEDKQLSAASWTGLVDDSTSYINVTGGTNAGAVAAWSTGSVVTTASSLVVGCCYADRNTATANTPTAPSAEIHDFADIANLSLLATEYRIEANAGTYAIAGTLTGGTPNATVAPIVAYLADIPVQVAWITA